MNETTLTRQQLIDEAWYRGNLRYKLHAGQKKIDDAFKAVTQQLFVGNISRQFGKTYWAVTKALELAIKKPKSRIKIGTAFQTDLVELILPKFAEVLADCPEQIMPKYKSQGSKWVFKNGSEIKLIGLDKNPNGLRGNVLDLICIDEAGFVSNLDYIYKSVIVPATAHRPNCKIILISTPPEQATAHPFGDFITRADLQGAYVKLDIYQNPMLKQSDIDRLAKESGGINSVTFRREYLCELIVDQTKAVLPQWNDLSQFAILATPKPVPAFFKAIVAIDLAANDDTGCLFGYWDFERARVVIQAELLLNGQNTKVISDKCREVELHLWGEDITPMRWADGQLITINDICALHKYSISPVRKDVLEAQVNSLQLILQSRQLEIYPECKQTIRQCETATWNKARDKFARSGSCHQDLLASLIYLVRHISKENPFPKDYGFNNETMWAPRRQKNESHANLKKAFSGSKRF